MAEHPEGYGWWLNELDSLSIRTEKINELNDLKEFRNLTQNIKQALYQDQIIKLKISKIMIGTLLSTRIFA